MQYFGFDRPSFAFKTYGFGGNPDAAILALFAGGKQGVWYDPSDKSTLFQDVAGTVPVTKDGDPIGLMKDKSGNGYHATQTVSTARPTYRTNGILHWLKFDGVDDYLKTNYTPTTAWTASAAIAATLARVSMVFEGYSTEGKSPNMYIQPDGRVTVWNMLSSEFNVTNPTYILNTPNVHSVTSSVSKVATVPVTVGARSTETTQSFFFEGRVFGLVVVSGVEQMDAVNSSLKVKGGVV